MGVISVPIITPNQHHQGMAIPRSQLVDDEIPMHYHLVSRCVRRSWLCGRDPGTGKDYNHRKVWLKKRLLHLAKYFAIEIDAFTIMDNHFHLVVFYDPTACARWSDTEVAQRWTEAFPPKTRNRNELDDLKQLKRDQLLGNPSRLRKIRKTLGSLSSYMKHVKQPIAWRANQEDKCTGHFFEGRFYSGALLNEEAVLAAMAYVDLNPVRAEIAKSIEQCQDSSIFNRLQVVANSAERLAEALMPLVSGLGDSGRGLPINLSDYCKQLNLLIDQNETDDAVSTWYAQVASIKKRHRVYGFVDELEQWTKQRGWRRLDGLLPG